ncbi:DUF4377 domain-containing protein [Labilibacter sediminis]|nr:DUF4377 domain-containing protein [Labilibacter sediminis]
MKLLKKYNVLIIASILLFSCNKDDEADKVRMRINSYRTVDFYYDTENLMWYGTQTGKDIGSAIWRAIGDELRGLDYEYGYVYDIEVIKSKIKDSNSGEENYRYDLSSIILKKDVVGEVGFNIKLGDNVNGNYITSVVKDNLGNYTLMDEVDINFGEHIEIVEKYINEEIQFYGFFGHKDHETIELHYLVTPGSN